MERKTKVLMADFETTVFEGQTYTEVWAAACVELYTEDVHIFHSIEEIYRYFLSLKSNLTVYFHNLKFDGSFWLSYLYTKLQYKEAGIETVDEQGSKGFQWMGDKDMPNKSFKYSISDMGQWYTITIKDGGKIIQFRDSLKLLPFSVSKIGKSFGTKHKKTEIEYKGVRYAGCEITDKEREYIANDVLVVKEALEIMFSEGHDKLTIGSCCLDEYKTIMGKFQYNMLFPDVYEFSLNPELHRDENAGEWIRRSYKGGWCYLVRGKENRRFANGTTADVNSLYPSMMSSESAHRYPVGKPHFWHGNYIPNVALRPNKYYFVRVRTRFYLKRGYLPFIQIKGNPLYVGTECLESSDVLWRGKYYNTIPDENGTPRLARVELTLTMTDFILFKEHYDLVDFEILDGCWFDTEIGIFDEYIEKYKKIKQNSTGAIREISKLFLNNLYGKMASSTNSSFKRAFVKDDGSLGFIQIDERNKKPGYIPVGAAITSYARNFTIRAAQKNYYGIDKPGFIYADTDSIHVDLPPEKIKGIVTHDKDFCCWKLESGWDIGYFVRQKTYIEHITQEDGKKIDTPYYNIKCAGMPETCKKLLIKSFEGYKPTPDEIANGEYTPEELEFISTKRKLEDFKVGLSVPGKLLPKRIPGGVLLTDTTYIMHNK